MHKKFHKLIKGLTFKRRKPVCKLRLLGRHRFVLPVAVFLLLLVLSVAGVLLLGGAKKARASNALIAIVSYDHVQRKVPTREPTVGALLNKLNVKLNEGDLVEPSADTPIDQDEFRVNVYRAQPIEVVDAGHKQFTFSAASTPRSIAEQTGKLVYPEDKIASIPTRNFIKDGAIGRRVVIDRATPVRLNLFGASVKARTHASTVGDLLKEKGVKLAKKDSVKPSLTTAVTNNQQIFVFHKGTKFVSKTVAIVAPIKTVNDSKLSRGTTAIRQQGSPGKKVVTYRVKLRNGHEINRKVIQTVVVVQPVQRIVARGTASLSGGLSQWLYKLRQCESGGNYQSSTGNGYYGAYQFSPSTWQSLGYSGLPSNAPPYEQDQAIIKNTLRSSGISGQNPGCYSSTGISNYPPQ